MAVEAQQHVLCHCLSQGMILLLQLAADDLLQLGNLGSSGVKKWKHDTNLLCQEPKAEGVEAKGHHSSLGLAQEVPNSPCLIGPGRLELLQPLLSNRQLLHLPLGQPLLPICQLRHPGVQVALPDVSSKLTCHGVEVGIFQSLSPRLKSGLAAVNAGLTGGQGFKLTAKLDVV
jgi:hypothetical protein